MSRIGAITPALLQLEQVRAARAEQAADAAPLRGPAAITELRSARQGFSSGEQRAIDLALRPFLAAMPGADQGRAMESLYAGLAESREAGEDSLTISVTFPDGSAVATTYSRAELLAALRSHDPGSMGRLVDNGGRVWNIRDMVRDALGEAFFGEQAPDSEQRMTAMVAAMLAGDSLLPAETDDLRSLALQAGLGKLADGSGTVTLLEVGAQRGVRSLTTAVEAREGAAL